MFKKIYHPTTSVKRGYYETRARSERPRRRIGSDAVSLYGLILLIMMYVFF